jgi:hypothetical protein
MAQQNEIAAALGLTKGRVSQLVKEGMPTSSIEEARAWRDSRKVEMQNRGHISQPVQPLNLSGLDSILRSVTGETGNSEMDTRVSEQTELCSLTRQVFMQALQSGDPAQGKLYANYDRAVATLLRLEKERFVRIQEEGRLIDAEAAAARFGKVMGQLRSQIERAELTFAPKANPDNPSKALKAYREFKEDLFRKISEYSPQVRDGSPQIGDDTIGFKPPPSPLSHLFPTVGDLEDEDTKTEGGSLENFTDDTLGEMEDENQ